MAFHNIHLSHCVFYAITFDTNTLYIVEHVLGSKFEIQIINVWTLEFRHTINFKVYNMRSDRIGLRILASSRIGSDVFVSDWIGLTTVPGQTFGFKEVSSIRYTPLLCSLYRLLKVSII